eukprot:Rmarinus@m.5539
MFPIPLDWDNLNRREKRRLLKKWRRQKRRRQNALEALEKMKQPEVQERIRAEEEKERLRKEKEHEEYLQAKRNHESREVFEERRSENLRRLYNFEDPIERVKRLKQRQLVEAAAAAAAKAFMSLASQPQTESRPETSHQPTGSVEHKRTGSILPLNLSDMLARARRKDETLPVLPVVAASTPNPAISSSAVGSARDPGQHGHEHGERCDPLYSTDGSLACSSADKWFCPFFLKVGACRYGDTCSRMHPLVATSKFLVCRNMYQPCGLVGLPDDGGEYELQHDEAEEIDNLNDFCADVAAELEKLGKVVCMRICQNRAPHMRGNVYVEFKYSNTASKAFELLNGRFYAGKQIYCALVPKMTWSSAICSEFARGGTCVRSSQCNFIHPYQIGWFNREANSLDMVSTGIQEKISRTRASRFSQEKDANMTVPVALSSHTAIASSGGHLLSHESEETNVHQTRQHLTEEHLPSRSRSRSRYVHESQDDQKSPRQASQRKKRHRARSRSRNRSRSRTQSPSSRPAPDRCHKRPRDTEHRRRKRRGEEQERRERTRSIKSQDRPGYSSDHGSATAYSERSTECDRSYEPSHRHKRSSERKASERKKRKKSKDGWTRNTGSAIRGNDPERPRHRHS